MTHFWRSLLFVAVCLLLGCRGNTTAPGPFQPILAISPSGVVGAPDENVTFAAVISGNAEAWEWEFDSEFDPAFSNAASPVISLPGAGNYSGRVRVRQRGEWGEWFVFDLRVSQISAPPEVGEILLLVSPVAGGPFTVFAQAFNRPQAWHWDFGGGTSPNISTDPIPTVTARSPGEYRGTVMASNEWGESVSREFVYEVKFNQLAGEPRFEAKLSPCGAFPQTIGELVQFEVTALQFPHSWEWDFGGGAEPNTVNDRAPVVKITKAGVHAATLLLTNHRGSELYRFTYAIEPWQSLSDPNASWAVPINTIGEILGTAPGDSGDTEILLNHGVWLGLQSTGCTPGIGGFNALMTTFSRAGNWSSHRQWATPVANASASITTSLTTQDGLYFCGTFRGQVDFDPSPQETAILESGFQGNFLLALDSQLNFRWVRELPHISQHLLPRLRAGNGNEIFVAARGPLANEGDSLWSASELWHFDPSGKRSVIATGLPMEIVDFAVHPTGIEAIGHRSVPAGGQITIRELRWLSLTPTGGIAAERVFGSPMTGVWIARAPNGNTLIHMDYRGAVDLDPTAGTILTPLGVANKGALGLYRPDGSPIIAESDSPQFMVRPLPRADGGWWIGQNVEWPGADLDPGPGRLFREVPLGVEGWVVALSAEGVMQANWQIASPGSSLSLYSLLELPSGEVVGSAHAASFATLGPHVLGNPGRTNVLFKLRPDGTW